MVDGGSEWIVVVKGEDPSPAGQTLGQFIKAIATDNYTLLPLGLTPLSTAGNLERCVFPQEAYFQYVHFNVY